MRKNSACIHANFLENLAERDELPKRLDMVTCSPPLRRFHHLDEQHLQVVGSRPRASTAARMRGMYPW
jgi:hypothetical protein